MIKNALDLERALDVISTPVENGIAWAYLPTAGEREKGDWDTEFVPAYKCAGPGLNRPFWRASRQTASLEDGGEPWESRAWVWEPGWVEEGGYLYYVGEGEEN